MLVSMKNVFPLAASLASLKVYFPHKSLPFTLVMLPRFFNFKGNLKSVFSIIKGVPQVAVGKESTCQCRRHERHKFNPWVGKIPWSRKWQPTPVFLPEYGQKSLAGYSPWSCKESDMTEHTHINHEDTCFTLYRCQGRLK